MQIKAVTLPVLTPRLPPLNGSVLLGRLVSLTHVQMEQLCGISVVESCFQENERTRCSKALSSAIQQELRAKLDIKHRQAHNLIKINAAWITALCLYLIMCSTVRRL